MNIKEFIEEIKKLNIDIDSDKMEKLQIYSNFLIEYNKHTNLTAIKEEKDIYLKHFYDSLTIVKIIVATITGIILIFNVINISLNYIRILVYFYLTIYIFSRIGIFSNIYKRIIY